MGVGMSQAIDANNTPSQDWRDVLSDLLQDRIPTDLTFDKPNRYYSTDEFILPSVAKEGIGNLAIFADASGSVSQPEFSQFMSDIQDITDELLPESVTSIPSLCLLTAVPTITLMSLTCLSSGQPLALSGVDLHLGVR